MSTVVLPWLPPMSAAFVGPEMTDAAEIESDPIARYDIEDIVDIEHYPNGRYWCFDKPDTLGRCFIVEGGKVSSILEFYSTLDDGVWCAERGVETVTVKKRRHANEEEDRLYERLELDLPH